MNNDLIIPNHIGIIMDGNGRWAHDNGLTRSEGHYNGFNNLESLSNYIFEKGIKAVETVDACIEKLINNIDLSKYTIIITADHGNCEQMINEDDTINTAHTTNLVPFIILDKNISLKKDYIGSLADIAPTILDIMNLDIPKEMSGNSLIEK